jgi:hypothetical protein
MNIKTAVLWDVLLCSLLTVSTVSDEHDVCSFNPEDT